MKILIVASEAVPFAKTGGLADVVGVMPRFLAELGHDVRVVMPRHYVVDPARYGLRQVGGPLGVPMGGLGEQWCSVLEGKLARCEVPVYFIKHDGYFGRENLYNEPGGQGYIDNDRRFVFLSRAALQWCKAIGFAPDVVHAHDWHTAALPVFLASVYRRDPAFHQTASVLTIHNMEYQGRYYPHLMDVLGVGWEHFNVHGLEWHGVVNLLKGGIYYADRVNTVSPGYAREIRTPRFGHGLEGAVVDRGSDVRGILNGIDYDEWNPETDPYLPARYSADELGGKASCKQALQDELGLPRRDVPVLGMVTRLVHQKGIDVLAEALEPLLRQSLQLAVLGSGEAWAHEFLQRTARRYPDRFAVRLGYDNGLAHRIEAGADFFLMPSRFEPCGSNQLFSLRYGTLPIVHGVGGLADTVENFDERTLSGTGFKFHDLTPRALYNTIGWALHTWYNRPDAIRVLMRRGMSQRFSWEVSARAYEQLYADAVRARR